MARPIRFTPEAPRIQSTAREELDRLLETCHEHGLLRFLNDLVGSNAQLAQVFVQGLQSEGAQNAIKNLSVLLMALSRIPPDQFYRLVFALRDGIGTFASSAQQPAKKHDAPGISGAYHMLQDDELWHSLTPLVAALKAFAAGVQKPIDNPINDFSGKPGRPS